MTVDTLQLASGEHAPPHVRSMKIMDWTRKHLYESMTRHFLRNISPRDVPKL